MMFTTPFLIGLASSLHCLGMCSPLAIAVSKVGKEALFRNLLYNGGRIMTYGILGSIVSFIGAGLDFVGIQQGVSIVVGAVIIAIGLANIHITSPRFINTLIIRLTSFVKTKFKLNPVFLGMINGLLPCGMTLIALGYCVTLAWPTDGLMAMVYFGIGTLPAMLGLSFVTQSLMQKLPFTYRRVQTTLLIVSGLLMVARGIYSQSYHVKSHDGIVVCGAGPQK